MSISAIKASQRLSVQAVEKATFSGKIPASDQTSSPLLIKAEVKRHQGAGSLRRRPWPANGTTTHQRDCIVPLSGYRWTHPDDDDRR